MHCSGTTSHFTGAPASFVGKVGYRVDSGDRSLYNADRFVSGSQTRCVVRIDHCTLDYVSDVGDGVFTVQP